MSILTDQELINLLKAKEKRGFDLLYDKYGKCLYILIIRIVDDRHLAEDVLQESLIKIWQQASAYHSSKGTLLNWLLTITRNTAHKRKPSSTYRGISAFSRP